MMRKLLLLAAFVLLSGVTQPARAQFCPGASGWVFDDVQASDPFCGYITWAARNGVTLGCLVIDANHRLYCPTADVARSQMAALVNRLATQPDSAAPDVGTITKPGGVFLHNFGTDNTFLGVSAGNFSMTGIGNTAIGKLALASNTTASGNVAVGAFALPINTTGFSNTAVGYTALQSNSTGSNNTASGTGALAANTLGNDNTGVGQSALHQNTTGGFNTAVGSNALLSNVSGQANTAIGSGALMTSSAGSDNVAVGVLALQVNTATGNVAVGSGTLNANTTGASNVAVGQVAMFFNQTGAANTAIGAQALLKSTNSNNTAVGANALINATTGGGNVAIGVNAGTDLDTGSNNIYVGHTGFATESATIRVGNPAQTRAFVAGVRGVATGTNDAVNVVIDSFGQLGTLSSTREVKDHIADMDDASAALMRLRPVTFFYKADNGTVRRLQYGLVAEEVADVYPGLVARGADGRVETVMYQFLAPMLLNEYQKQQRTIEAQQAELAELRTAHTLEIAELRRAVAVLMARTSPEGRVAAK